MAEEREDTRDKYTKTQNVEKVFVKATTSLHLENTAFTSKPSTGQRFLKNPTKKKPAENLSRPAFELKKKKREKDDAPNEMKATTGDSRESYIPTKSSTEIKQNLFNKDVQCIICHGADVWVGNPLLKCSNCHSIYHELCHYPRVLYDSGDEWICPNCKVSSVLRTESTPSLSNPIPSNVGKFPFIKLPHPFANLYVPNTSSDLTQSNPKRTPDPPKRIRCNLRTSTPTPVSRHAAKPPLNSKLSKSTPG